MNRRIDLCLWTRVNSVGDTRERIIVYSRETRGLAAFIFLQGSRGSHSDICRLCNCLVHYKNHTHKWQREKFNKKKKMKLNCKGNELNMSSCHSGIHSQASHWYFWNIQSYWCNCTSTIRVERRPLGIHCANAAVIYTVKGSITCLNRNMNGTNLLRRGRRSALCPRRPCWSGAGKLRLIPARGTLQNIHVKSQARENHWKKI